MNIGYLFFLNVMVLTAYMNFAYAQEKDDAFCHNIFTASIDPIVFAAVKELVSNTETKPIEAVLKDTIPPVAKSIEVMAEKDNAGKQEIIEQLVENDFTSPIVAHQTELDMYIASVYATNLTISDMQQLTAYYVWKKKVYAQLASSKDESSLPTIIQAVDSFNHSDLAKRESDDSLKIMDESMRVVPCIGEFILYAKFKLIDDFKKHNLIVPQNMLDH